MKILIAEDDSVSRMLLHRILTSEGNHEVIVAENGVMAWNHIQQGTKRPDLCILDIMMPEMNGLDLLRKIRQWPGGKAIQVVLCTTLRDRQTVLKAAELGIKGYLIKPYAKQAVLDLVRKVHKDVLLTMNELPAAAAARLGVNLETYKLWLRKLHRDAEEMTESLKGWMGGGVRTTGAGVKTKTEAGATATIVSTTPVTPGSPAKSKVEPAPAVLIPDAQLLAKVTQVKNSAIDLGVRNVSEALTKLETFMLAAGKPQADESASVPGSSPPSLADELAAAVQEFINENQRLHELIWLADSPS